MSKISPQRLFGALDATWAPLEFSESGPFTLRVGAGGGKRVSAATGNADVSARDIETAEIQMKRLGQTPLFMIRDGDEPLDALLDHADYKIVDPVIVFAHPVETLGQQATGDLTTIACEMPLAAQQELWATDNIGPARIDVMHRSANPHTFMMGRLHDRISGTLFVSCDQEIAMLHALVVAAHVRRQGMGSQLTFGAAKWAERQGAKTLALMATRENKAACKLYENIGMEPICHYHYRIKTE